jgi:hypothetical protein
MPEDSTGKQELSERIYMAKNATLKMSVSPNWGGDAKLVLPGWG